MTISFNTRKNAFFEVRKELERIILAENVDFLSEAGKALYSEIVSAQQKNPWFTSENVRSALQGIKNMLNEDAIENWLSAYNLIENENPKTIAVIMAGNIPFVGFHDMMCVLLSGNYFLGKLSSHDKDIPVRFADLLFEVEPAFKDYVKFSYGTIKDFDAVIATGSNNSARYFEYYFGKYPHIIRKNRSSMGILSGNESKEELQLLADDIFMYYGMGCRNVSKILLPLGYNCIKLLDSFMKYDFLINHHKFYNNYEYQKAIMLVNSIHHYDTGFSLLVKDKRLSSPLSVVYFDEYESNEQVKDYISINRENLQCIVTIDNQKFGLQDTVKPGESQNPGPGDYADGVDTLAFLMQLTN
jgi:hypothetical protein